MAWMNRARNNTRSTHSPMLNSHACCTLFWVKSILVEIYFENKMPLKATEGKRERQNTCLPRSLPRTPHARHNARRRGRHLHQRKRRTRRTSRVPTSRRSSACCSMLSTKPMLRRSSLPQQERQRPICIVKYVFLSSKIKPLLQDYNAACKCVTVE